jgi:membrane-bound serine protease (ClpP class)
MLRLRRRLATVHLGLIAGGLLLGLLGQVALPAAQEPEATAERRPVVYVAEFDGIIHPISAEYMIHTMDEADAAGADLVVFILRTPGGLVDSTRTIISRMIAAKTPVAVFVSPGGARAASAGFYITLAADVAAMSPGTHIGAAHPVAAGGGGEDDTMAKKAAADLAAYARSLAAQRNRNVDLAEEAVLESRAFTETEALGASPPLIDLIASDLDELLRELHGREVTRFDGTTATLRTQEAQRQTVEMTWRQQFLSAIAHPQVAFILFSLGTLGLTIELWNPGGILPGVVGGVCLLLAFFAFQILPVNYVGLLLIIFGMVLLILELVVTSFGLLAVGGVISLVLGAMMLIDSPMPEMQLGLRVVLPVMVTFAALFLFLARLGLQAHLRQSEVGATGMIGKVGRATTAIEPGAGGRVAVHGEIWSARSAEPIAAGETVRVTGLEGLTITVERAPSQM